MSSTSNTAVVQRKNRTVLLVDDEPMQLHFLSTLLRKEGYAIHTASNGQEALDILSQQEICLVISDQKMPHMNGIELMGKINELYPHTMRIVLSGYAELGSVLDAINHGSIYKYITKPIDNKSFCEIIRNAFKMLDQKNQQKSTPTELEFEPIIEGLISRMAFNRQLKQLIESNQKKNEPQGALLFLTLERYKIMASHLGLDVERQILKQIITRIHSYLHGALITQFSNHELILCLPEATDPLLAEQFSNQLIQAINIPFLIQEYQLRLGLSVGLALYNKNLKTEMDWIRQTHCAVFRAIEHGGNQLVRYEPTMISDFQHRLTLERDLASAIDENELIVHFQPQVDGKKKVCGMEALVRWQHPKLGLVPPNKFIPIAEESHLILKLGEWVLKNVCKKVKEWQAQYEDPFITSINLSAQQFLSSDIVKTIADVLAESDISPSSIELEITESTLMEHNEKSLEILKQLKSLGVHLALDDFGTGYSSLSYLNTYPFDTLKIDKSFVTHITQKRENAAIVRSIMDIAEQLDMKIIVEGVETEAQWNYFSELSNCIIQGFYFSPPLPEMEVKNLLDEQFASTK